MKMKTKRKTKRKRKTKTKRKTAPPNQRSRGLTLNAPANFLLPAGRSW